MKTTRLLTIGLASLATLVLADSFRGLTGRTAHAVETAVTPSAYENADGPLESGIWPQASRAMQIYDSVAFDTEVPIRITSLNLRPDARHAIGARFGFDSLTLRFAVTQVTPNDMSPEFEANVADANTEPMVVFDEAWTREVVSVTPASGARPFDFKIPLTTPFEIAPSDGNLLIDWNFGTPIPQQASFDRGHALFDQVTYFSSGQSPVIGEGGPFSVVAQFEFETVPEPATGLATLTALACLGLLRRRRGKSYCRLDGDTEFIPTRCPIGPTRQVKMELAPSDAL